MIDSLVTSPTAAREPAGPKVLGLPFGLDELAAWVWLAICVVFLGMPPGPPGTRAFAAAGAVAGLYAMRKLKRQRAELRMVRAEKQQAETVAAAAVHVRSDLLAALAHELRVPIHAVSGLVELSLADVPEKGEARARLELIRKASRRQLRLVDDILDFACLESGTLRIERADFSPRELTAECVELLLPKAEDRGLQLTWTALPSVPNRVHGDGDRWRQVLLNLLANGVKYTRRGRVDVRLDVTEDAGFRHLRCRVRDTGVGLLTSDRRRLFEPFARADTTLARTSAGVGLGLAVCRRLVALMEGELGCESERGKGSTFYFSLPLQASTKTEVGHPAAGDTAVGHATQDGDGGVAPLPHFPAGTRILVVDDDLASRLVARGFLEPLGCEVGEACNGAQALEKLRCERWDLVLLDGRMPELDGEQTVTELRGRLADPKNRPTVIAVGADRAPGERERRLALGFDDDLPKPFDRHTLAAALARWLPTAHETCEPSASGAHGEAPPPAALSGRETLTALWRLGLHTGEDELGRAVIAFENLAHQSLEALRSTKLSDLAGAAHDLASSAGILGLAGVGELAAQLAESARGESRADFQEDFRRLQSAVDEALAELNDIRSRTA